MTFPYKHVLLVGATSGIGEALANKLITRDIKVTAVGRRKDRLEKFVEERGEAKASAAVLDITDQDAIPTFASNIMEAHPSIDCIFLNAGIQHHYNFAMPETLDLARFHREITTNFTSFVTLTHAFLPYLLSTTEKRGIIFTGTHISLIPASAMPAYSASKAALDAFMMCLREQLRETNVKVIHISPPLVQSELHDAEMGPEKGRSLGMPALQFADQAFDQLLTGNENIYIGSIGGSSQEQFMEIVEKRDGAFARLSDLLKSF